MKTKTRNLPVELTGAEIRAKGEELARTVNEQSQIEDEKKKANADFTTRLKTTSNFIFHLSNIVESGKEFREVVVTEEFFYRENVARVYRSDTGELVDTRSLTKEELQRGFFETEEDDVVLINK